MRVAYFDIETCYEGPHKETNAICRDVGNHRLTVIGIRIIDGLTDDFVQLVGRQISKESLLKALEGVEQIVTYNGRSLPDSVKQSVGFDFPVIAAQLRIVLDKMFRHVDLVPLCWQHGLYGGLKKVEQALGLKRKLPGREGAWASETWRRYAQTKDTRLLEELLAYNKEDVFMLREVENRLKGLR